LEGSMRPFSRNSYRFLAERRKRFLVACCVLLPRPAPDALALAIVGLSAYGRGSPQSPRHSPVTGGARAPAAKQQEHSLRRSRLADWIVPPVIVPLLLLILVLAAAIFHA
ncbi:hypothetical protein ACFFWD_41875, partial [Bradyrhizobium erythrophlei]|uniref:hypothetical protein n=1 Tax=Bradyrhizobium erythrophlei TaxID=1437360 RepID=UPI0035EE8E9A